MNRSLRHVLSASLFVAIACVFQAAGTQSADAQCDPGMPIAEIYQNNVFSGWVARIETRGGYAEYWCLLANFRNFGSRVYASTATRFEPTNNTFNATAFSDQCRASHGSLHVGDVHVRF